MKEVGRAFAMQMLKIEVGKSEEQILDEAKHHTGDWTMGLYELEMDIHALQKQAQVTLEHFRYQRPSVVTLNDIREIHGKVHDGKRPEEGESYLERYRKRLNTIFDIYEEAQDKD